MQIILNQDRDILVLFNAETDMLYTMPVLYEKKLYGINLMCNGVMLGTFDSVGEALGEMNSILECIGTSKVYMIKQ